MISFDSIVRRNPAGFCGSLEVSARPLVRLVTRERDGYVAIIAPRDEPSRQTRGQFLKAMIAAWIVVLFSRGLLAEDVTAPPRHSNCRCVVVVTPCCANHCRVWNRSRSKARRAQWSACERICTCTSISTAILAPAATRPAEVLPALGPQTRQLGKSVLGLPIVGHFFGVTGPKTLIFAAIHGDEPNTAFVAHQLVEHLTKHSEAYRDRRVVVVPVANPDGLARGTRINARAIDLNRNFPAKNFAVGKKDRYFGGEQPASEPESQLLIELVESWQPDRIITLHAIPRGKHGNNFDGPAEELAKAMSRHNEYSVLKTIGYPTPGSFGSWAGIDRKLPTITLELPTDASGPTAWRENREALLSAIQSK